MYDMQTLHAGGIPMFPGTYLVVIVIVIVIVVIIIIIIMPAKHFRWTVYMLKYDIMTHLNEFLMLFLVFELRHFPH